MQKKKPFIPIKGSEKFINIGSITILEVKIWNGKKHTEIFFINNELAQKTDKFFDECRAKTIDLIHTWGKFKEVFPEVNLFPYHTYWCCSARELTNI